MIIKPPYSISTRRIDKKCIFLAGSIEQGKADNWQSYLEKELEALGFTIFNPRVDNWDTEIKEDIKDPAFCQQVNWELNGLEKANFIVMYFDPNTKSPVSLMELGLWAGSDKMVVCCPEGYWKKGNVDIVCQKYDIPQVPDLDRVIEYFKIIQGLS